MKFLRANGDIVEVEDADDMELEIEEMDLKHRIMAGATLNPSDTALLRAIETERMIRETKRTPDPEST